MLLCSILWTAGTIPVRLPAVRLFMLSAINSSLDKCRGSPLLSFSSNLLLQPGPSPSAPAGSPGSNCWTGHRQLRITHCRLLPPPAQATTQMRKRMSNPAASSVGERVSASDVRQDKTCCIPACALSPFTFWISSWQSCWSACAWCPSSRSRVPSDQSWKVVYLSLVSCLLGRGCRINFNKTRQISRHVSKMYHLFGKVQLGGRQWRTWIRLRVASYLGHLDGVLGGTAKNLHKSENKPSYALSKCM